MVEATIYEGLSTSTTMFGGPTCTGCPSQAAVAEGIEGLALAGMLTEEEVYYHLDTTCHGCLAEGMAQRVGLGRWEVHLLAYADDPTGVPMPADGSVR